MAVGRLGKRLPNAQPADLVFLGYVAFSGALIAAFGGSVMSSALRAALVAAHAAMIVTGLWFARYPARDRSWFGVLRDVYPLLFIAPLYFELRYLAQVFSGGYHDVVILRLEEVLFGEQLAMTFSQRLPIYWLSELLHFFYAIYWALLPLAAAGLYLRRRIEGLRELVFVELIVFFACYVIFIFFPVAGPHYEFPRIGGELAEGPLYRFVHWVLEDGGSKGAAFPSSHVAAAVAVLLVTWRHDRLVWAGMLPLVAGLTISTVYGRFHYGIDALSGIAVALVVVPLARRLRRRLAAEAPAEAGNRAVASVV